MTPDGSKLAYLKPVDGVLNAWVRSAAGGDDRVVTEDTYRGIRQIFWAEDSKTLLYLQDDGGDENFHLFAVDVSKEGSKARDLTPFDGAKAQNVITNKRFPDELLVAVNARDKAQFDMYRTMWKSKFYGAFLNRCVVLHAIDATPARWRGDAGSSPLDGASTAASSPRNVLVKNCRVHPTHWLISTHRYRVQLESGDIKLDTENPGGIVGWGSEDESFEVREGIRVNPDSSKTVLVRDSTKAEWRDLAVFPYGEEGGMVDFCGDGEHALMTSSVGRETTALTKVKLSDGSTTEVIAFNDKADCGGIM